MSFLAWIHGHSSFGVDVCTCMLKYNNQGNLRIFKGIQRKRHFKELIEAERGKFT